MIKNIITIGTILVLVFLGSAVFARGGGKSGHGMGNSGSSLNILDMNQNQLQHQLQHRNQYRNLHQNQNQNQNQNKNAVETLKTDN
ncbi:hypothetical protein [Desulfobacula sp.]|uniref:hypothetical protein n=1 Tax=Desulfobacula sp. TaxID=2593537 RepID=UPI00271462D0|nr:hypothetical protein [Desulfobacula sp.]